MNSKGLAMTMVIMVIIALMGVCAAAMQMAYNFNLTATALKNERIQQVYKTQAGIVDAQWRIRTNTTAGLVGAGGGFENAAYNPDDYYLDLDTDPPTMTNAQTEASDVMVDISNEIGDGFGTRQIVVIGFK